MRHSHCDRSLPLLQSKQSSPGAWFARAQTFSRSVFSDSDGEAFRKSIDQAPVPNPATTFSSRMEAASLNHDQYCRPAEYARLLEFATGRKEF
jgi:hypothetical protein